MRYSMILKKSPFQIWLIKALRNIKPDKIWIICTRNQSLKEFHWNTIRITSFKVKSRWDHLTNFFIANILVNFPFLLPWISKILKCIRIFPEIFRKTMTWRILEIYNAIFFFKHFLFSIRFELTIWKKLWSSPSEALALLACLTVFSELTHLVNLHLIHRKNNLWRVLVINMISAKRVTDLTKKYSLFRKLLILSRLLLIYLFTILLVAILLFSLSLIFFL